MYPTVCVCVCESEKYVKQILKWAQRAMRNYAVCLCVACEARGMTVGDMQEAYV